MGPTTLVLYLLATATATVRHDGVKLRSSCSSEAELLTELKSGTNAAIRASLSGDLGTCYKISAGGQTGWVLASELTGLESYEQARSAATDKELPQLIRAEMTRLREEAATRTEAGMSGTVPVAIAATVSSAIQLIETNQPRQALELIETKLLAKNNRDAFLLSLAGLAAYQSDQPRRAVEFWQQSLSIQPNPSIEQLYRRAQKELAADTSRQRVQGNHFLLRYNPGEVSETAAAQLMQVLETEFVRLQTTLGCRADEKIVAVVQNLQAYRASTDAAEWSGGQFDGRIRVPLSPGGTITPDLQHRFSHEIVHACLAQFGRWPAWFHEGMAQKHSGETLDSMELSALRAKIRSHQMPKLSALSQSWSRMSAQHARLAYAMSLAAIEVMYQSYGEQYMRNLLRNPEVLPGLAEQVSRSLLGY